jgi:hypothetical protein
LEKKSSDNWDVLHNFEQQCSLLEKFTWVFYFLQKLYSYFYFLFSEKKYKRRTAGYIWTDYKTNTQIAKELKVIQILDKLLEYNRNWIQHVNRMPRNRLPRVMKQYSPTCRRNHCRLLKRLLDAGDPNGSTSGPTP